MFSGLNQGSRVYILNKTNGIEFKIGEIVGTTTPVFATDGTNMMVVNLKVKVDGSNVDYNNIQRDKCETVMGVLGEVMVSDIKQTIQKGSFVPDAPATVKTKQRKGKSEPDHPLIDTGQMLDSIISEVVK